MSKHELLLKLTTKGILWILLVLFITANVVLANADASLVHSVVSRVTNVLGVQSSKTTEERQRTTALWQEYRYWQEIVRDHQDYRDGYVRLAMLSYQLALLEESKSYVAKIRSLDPNFQGIVQLEALLAPK